MACPPPPWQLGVDEARHERADDRLGALGRGAHAELGDPPARDPQPPVVDEAALTDVCPGKDTIRRGHVAATAGSRSMASSLRTAACAHTREAP
jgi:hypothetical protein